MKMRDIDQQELVKALEQTTKSASNVLQKVMFDESNAHYAVALSYLVGYNNAILDGLADHEEPKEKSHDEVLRPYGDEITILKKGECA